MSHSNIEKLRRITIEMDRISDNRKCMASLAVFRALYDKEKDLYSVIASSSEQLMAGHKLKSCLQEFCSLFNGKYGFELPSAVIKRNSTIEILRILSMFLIMWYHLCGRGLGFFDARIPNMGGGNPLPLMVMHALGMIGVPIFIFISGYYGLRFKWNRLKDILFQSVLYTIVFYLLACMFLPIFEFHIAVLNVFGLSFLWFVKYYIVLYLLSDGINAVLDKLDFKMFSLVIALLLFIAVGNWITHESALSLFLLVEYYTIARYVRKYSDKYRKYIKLLMLPSVLLFVLPVCYGYYSGHYSAIYPYVFSYYNPLLIVIAMSMVVIADDFKTYSKLVNYVSSSVLAVYMLHENRYVPTIVNPYFHFEVFSPLRAFLVIAMIFGVAVCVDKLRIQFSKQLKMIYKRAHGVTWCHDS